MLTQWLRLDWLLFALLGALVVAGLAVLWSASGQSDAMLHRQLVRIAIAVVFLFLVARIPPEWLRELAPLLYFTGLLMLIAVLLFGAVGKGAQRWLDLGFMRFQPSELMKLAVPMMVARYLAEEALPPTLQRTCVALALCLVPAVLIVQQPDLGTAILVATSGLAALFLAGLQWWLIALFALLAAAAAPLFWLNMHDYQRQRVLTLFDPEADPLGAGYHIIQSKIAIGSGGLFGKGWLEGTQSHLNFLPERHTDFIFAVLGEELGLVGALLLLLLYLCIVLRCLLIAVRSRLPFSRLLAGSLGLTFFVYLFVNVAMVSGMIPVVGVPLPLVSYGGTSMLTLMVGFGLLMSIANQKQILA